MYLKFTAIKPTAIAVTKSARDIAYKCVAILTAL